MESATAGYVRATRPFPPLLVGLCALGLGCSPGGAAGSGQAPSGSGGSGAMPGDGSGTGGSTSTGGMPGPGSGGSGTGTGGATTGAGGATTGAGGATTGAGGATTGAGGSTTGAGGSTTGAGGSGGLGVPPVTIRDPFNVVTGGFGRRHLRRCGGFSRRGAGGGRSARDVQRVSGTAPTIKNATTGLSATAIIVGTLGKSPVIDALAFGRKAGHHGRRRKVGVVRHPGRRQSRAPA